MWILSEIGFFSIVQKPWDRETGTLTIRARSRDDLVNLKRRALPDMTRIEEDSSADYRYRAQAPRASVAAAMEKLAAEIDYDNFKSRVAKAQGPARASLYSRIWAILAELQPRSSTARKFRVDRRNRPGVA